MIAISEIYESNPLWNYMCYRFSWDNYYLALWDDSFHCFGGSFLSSNFTVI